MTNPQRGLLLASFLVTEEDEIIQREVEFLAENMSLSNNYIFLLRCVDEPTKKILTYNAFVEKGRKFHPSLYTTRVHRKKQTNTIYTINALNLAVAEQHDGKTGRDLKLDWSQYENTLLLSQGKKLQVHPIEVVKIFKIEEPPEEN